MSGRRRHARYELSNSEGLLRILSDVTVQQGDHGDLIITSCEARRLGDVLTLELVNEPSVRMVVRVAESQPIIVGGSVRHQLRLVPLRSDGGSRPREGTPRE
jgi:hypothetical protein